MLSSFTVRLRALIFRRSVDAELAEELRYHLDRETERNMRGGMSASDAQYAARRAMGNIGLNTEEARDAWRWKLFEELRQDIAFGARSFRRAPMFVGTVVATIGLGLGLLSAAFTLFDTYLLRPVPARDPFALYELAWHARNGVSHAFGWNQYRELAARRDVFSGTFAYVNQYSRIRGAPASGQLVTANYFQVLGVAPFLGRVLVPDDSDTPGANAVVVLSHRTWQTTFNGDSSVVGTIVQISGLPFTIVGVAPKGFGGLAQSPFDYWVPITMLDAVAPRTAVFTAPDSESVRVVARVRDGISPEGVRAVMTTWLTTATARRPLPERVNEVFLVSRATMVPRSTEAIQLFAPIGIAFLLILLIACANVGNMMLARGLARQREVGIRLALGAGRARLVRQLLTESLLLAMPAGIAAYAVSRVAIALALQAMLTTVPEAYRQYLRIVPLDATGRVLLFMLLAAIAVAALFGLVPALQTTRPNIVQASRGDFDSQYRPSGLRSGLVIAQVSLSVLLLISAGVLLSGSRQTSSLDPGVRVTNIVQLGLLDSRRERVLAALRDRADVRSVASASSGPLDGLFPSVPLIAGTRAAESVSYNLVSSEYFRAIDLPIVAGRGFTVDEARDHAAVAVVSRSTANRFWPARNPIGETVTISPSAPRYAMMAAYHTARVIGIAGDAVPGLLMKPATAPVVYYPQPLVASGAELLLRVTGDAEQERAALDHALALAVDSAAVTDIHTLEASHALQEYPMQAAYWLASVIGVIALGLTVTGTYGVLVYVVTQRRKEFGIRMALGGGAASLVALVMRHALRLSLIGIVTGATIALGLSRLIGSVIRVIDTFNVIGYAGGIVIVLITCLVASYIPARRAARVNPVETLRADS